MKPPPNKSLPWLDAAATTAAALALLAPLTAKDHLDKWQPRDERQRLAMEQMLDNDRDQRHRTALAALDAGLTRPAFDRLARLADEGHAASVRKALELVEQGRAHAARPRVERWLALSAQHRSRVAALPG